MADEEFSTPTPAAADAAGCCSPDEGGVGVGIGGGRGCSGLERVEEVTGAVVGSRLVGCVVVVVDVVVDA